MAITLDGLTVKTPPEFAPMLMKQAFEQSVVGQLTPSEPLPLQGKSIPVYDGGFEVGYVPEGGAKPVSDVQFSVKKITPIKLAGIILVSMEAARLDPAGMMRIIEADMRNAISRGIDYGVLYGKSAYDGTDIPAVTAVNQTTNRVELDLAKDLTPQIIAGYDLAAANLNADPNGFAFDSQLRSKVAMATQVMRTPQGAPQPMPNLAVAADTVAGLKAAYGRVVAGRVGSQGDTLVRGFVGDWAKVRWGYGSQIELASSAEATVVDAAGKEWHTFQDNMRAYRIEATVGWAILDPTAFAAYEVAGTTVTP